MHFSLRDYNCCYRVSDESESLESFIDKCFKNEKVIEMLSWNHLAVWENSVKIRTILMKVNGEIKVLLVDETTNVA